MGNTPTLGNKKESAFRQEPTAVWGVSTLLGLPVRNDAGDDLGTLEEIMLDIDGGRIAYVAIAFGESFGRPGKLFAIRWSALYIDQLEPSLRFNVDREALAGAPGFDKGKWPDTADFTWVREAYRRLGYPDPPG